MVGTVRGKAQTSEVIRISYALDNGKQTQQQCLAAYYNTTASEVVDFGSLLGLVPGWSPNAKTNIKEIATLGAAKAVGLKGSAKLASTYDVQQIRTLNSLVKIPSEAGGGLDTIFHFLSKAVLVVTTAAIVIDISAHYACWAAAPGLANSWAQGQQY